MQQNISQSRSQLVGASLHQQQQQPRGSAVPQQAARWLLGRRKDGSQRFLLMQNEQPIPHAIGGAAAASLPHAATSSENLAAGWGRGAPWPAGPQLLAEQARGTGQAATSQLHHASSSACSSTACSPNNSSNRSGLDAASWMRAQSNQQNSKVASRPQRNSVARNAVHAKSSTAPKGATLSLPTSSVPTSSVEGFGVPQRIRSPLQAGRPPPACSQPLAASSWQQQEEACGPQRKEQQQTNPTNKSGLVLRAALPLHWQQQQHVQQQQQQHVQQQQQQHDQQQQQHVQQQQQQQHVQQPQQHVQQQQYMQQQQRVQQQQHVQHQHRQQQQHMQHQQQFNNPHLPAAELVVCASQQCPSRVSVEDEEENSQRNATLPSAAPSPAPRVSALQRQQLQTTEASAAFPGGLLKCMHAELDKGREQQHHFQPMQQQTTKHHLQQQTTAHVAAPQPLNFSLNSPLGQNPFNPRPLTLQPETSDEKSDEKAALCLLRPARFCPADAKGPLGVSGCEAPQQGTLFGALSAEQRQVVDAPPQCSVCVLAGPGAGKTTTITARIVRLLVLGCRPLAALTFTKKGASELERRIRVGLAGILADRRLDMSSSFSSAEEPQENDLFVGTFHSFFMRLLKTHGGPLGVPNNFRVLGQFQQLLLLKNLIERERRAQAQRHGGAPAGQALSAALRGHPSEPQVSSDENAEVSADEGSAGGGAAGAGSSLFGGDAGGNFNSVNREAEELRRRIRSMKFLPKVLQKERAAASILFRLFCDYNRHLKTQQPPLLDFTDLTVLSLRLLEREDMRMQLRALWPYLVVDEFQDTNSNQFKFLSLLALRRPPNNNNNNNAAIANLKRGQGGITVVGDDDQSIYKWRGTHTGIFHEFRRTFPNYREFFLVCNYRSLPLVVRHSLSLVSFNWPFRISKNLYSVHAAKTQKSDTWPPLGAPGGPWNAQGATDGAEPPAGDVRGAFLPSQSLEAQYILRYILCVKQKHHFRWDDFAILCRTNSALADVQRLLMDPRIQRAACDASVQFTTANSTHGFPDANQQHPAAAAADPNTPVDPALLFPGVNLNSLELPTNGLPVASTTSKRAGGAEIFLRPDAVDLLAYLRLAVDPHHDASFMRILNRPPRRIGAKTLSALKRVQKCFAAHAANEEEKLHKGLEMPWEELPWGRDHHHQQQQQQQQQQQPSGTHRKASLFAAMCDLLRAAGRDSEDSPANFTGQSVAEAEAARLRVKQMESLSTFAKEIRGLCEMSLTSASVKEMLEFVLGQLRLGKFFAERRLTQRARAGDGVARGGGATEDKNSAVTGNNTINNTNNKCDKSVTLSDATGQKLEQIKAPCRPVKLVRCKRKTGCTDTAEDAGESFGGCNEDTGESLKDLCAIYGSETFADVLGLLRSVEPYVPNWQQTTARECILRLLRDAGAGRCVQQKVTNAVTLSTIHQAKGLEWPVVILARANDGTLPMGIAGSQPVADFVARILSCFAAKQPTPEALQRAEATISKQAAGNEQHFHLMEERRVCYVALTRAKRFLLLTAPLADRSNHPLQPSRFFREACLVKQQTLMMQTATDSREQDAQSVTTAETSGDKIH